ncbi:hypothetical protein [Veillonella magna]|uniref:Uncharacterized protein n=1 Tax=Veillonella magna TaxID=464322 RepID=A0ABS2GH18_9FIRM|nr:hypothetical protein [Veillonella magna]MBM6824804.1 hypothetical protein [Veillonella magna]MBM6913117.1 hypothetical protein [Veillonella magna]
MIVHVVNVKKNILSAMSGVTAVMMLQKDKAQIVAGRNIYIVSDLLRIEKSDGDVLNLIVDTVTFRLKMQRIERF